MSVKNPDSQSFWVGHNLKLVILLSFLAILFVIFLARISRLYSLVVSERQFLFVFTAATVPMVSSILTSSILLLIIRSKRFRFYRNHLYLIVGLGFAAGMLISLMLLNNSYLPVRWQTIKNGARFVDSQMKTVNPSKQPVKVEQNDAEITSSMLESILPTGSFLRDYKQIDETKYLIIYLKPGYVVGEPNYESPSCPSEILGQAIIGDYRVALISAGKIVSDISVPNIPNFESDTKLALVYKNVGLTTNSSGVGITNDGLQATKISLLNLADYTGDGIPNEFVLTTTSGGCGFYDSIVIGLDTSIQKVKLYSDWIAGFNPDNTGNAYYLFDCGNHGNNIKVEKWYTFNKAIQKYELVRTTNTPCQLP